jgi:septum formation protein
MLLFFDFVVKIASAGTQRRPSAMPFPLPLILASTSPYRKELLSRLGLAFETVSPDTDEAALPGELPAVTALRLAEAKARAVAARYPAALIIGSDQVAHIGAETFGKPGNHENAVVQLRRLSGKTVDFVTGLCLFNSAAGISRSLNVTTRVRFRDLAEHTIEAYLRREQPYNCAGSAKSEGLGIALIARMECDDPTALVGLPLIALCDLLAQEGVSALA